MGWNVDLPRLKSLNKYWRNFPPVSVLLALQVGYKPPSEQLEEKSASTQKLDEFMGSIPQYKFIPPKVNENGK